MRMLGAVLAGGRSSRFGSDKALATIDGRSLLDHATARMAGWCEAVVVVGRPDGAVPDWPAPGMGPVGGVGGALVHAAARGLSHVLTIPVDALDLPDDLPARLSPAPAFALGCPVIGLWPADRASLLGKWALADPRRSMRGLAHALSARAVDIGPVGNINTPADLARVAAARDPR